MSGPHEKQIKLLEEKVQRLQRSNQEHMKKAFTAEQRGFHIARMLGFEDVSEAEDAISSQCELYHRSNIEATPAVIQSLQSTIRRQEIIIEKSETAYQSILREVAQVREQNERLLQEIDQVKRSSVLSANTHVHSSDTTPKARGGSSSVHHDKTPLIVPSSQSPEYLLLKARYDALLDVKQRAAERYKQDYKKWKDFKEWLFKEKSHSRRELDSLGVEDRLKTRLLHAERRKKYFQEFGPGPLPENSDGPPQPPDSDEVEVQSRSAPPQQSANARGFSPATDASVTQPETQEFPAICESLRTGLVAAEQPKDEPKSSQTEPETQIPSPLPQVPALSPFHTPNNRRPADGNMTINAAFKINTAYNQGRDFQFDTVVRDKEARKRMHGGDCECCHDYYAAVGPLPNRLQQPRWRSASPVPQRETSKDSAAAIGNVTEGDIAIHRDKISRHRYVWERAKTPPGYWNIGFPTTQEAVGINEEAQEMYRSKRKAIEMESELPHGRYVKR